MFIANINDPLTTRVWFSFEDDLLQSSILLSKLPSSKQIRVTFDPDCGMATNVEILSWR